MSLKVYRGRTLARSQALQLLFQAEATDSPLERVLEGDFLISKGPLDPYALELCRGAYEHIDRIDCALRAVAKNWDLMRMPGADRNLLRIAVYEMRFLTDEEVSDAIVINEESAPGYLASNPDFRLITFSEGNGFTLPAKGSCVGLRKSDTELLAQINEILATIDSDARTEMWNTAVANQPK